MTTMHNLDDALARAAERQRTERRRALLAVLVPAAIGAVFLFYATSQLTTATKQVDSLRTEAKTYEDRIAVLTDEVGSRTKEIEDLQTKLQTLEQQLKQTTQLSRFTHPMDLVDLKTIFSRAPAVAPVLGTILEQRERDVGWSLGGTDPTRGFDSPSFAAFVLRQHGALPSEDGAAGEDLLERSRRLFDTLPPTTGTPQPGDLVFYPAGYALFWFIDRNARPFVIGMTPTGIVALEPNFAERIGVRRPKYR